VRRKPLLQKGRRDEVGHQEHREEFDAARNGEHHLEPVLRVAIHREAEPRVDERAQRHEDDQIDAEHEDGELAQFVLRHVAAHILVDE